MVNPAVPSRNGAGRAATLQSECSQVNRDLMTKPVMPEMSPAMTGNGSLLADRVLPGLHLHLAGRERRRRRAALLEVLVGLRFLLFLVAAHLTLGHDVSPWRPLKEWRAPRIANARAFVIGGCALGSYLAPLLRGEVEAEAQRRLRVRGSFPESGGS